MPFTIEAVALWIVQRYRDQIGRSAADGTNFFSLLHSVLSEYPEEWLCGIEALTLGLSRGDLMQCANAVFPLIIL